MAKLSKICHSATCGGTKQPIELKLIPPTQLGENQVAYTATCTRCGATHPPDSTEIVTDGRAWAAATRARHGGEIPVPLPTTSRDATA
ncbi:MAG: hypothetical protein Q8Q14_14365 [Gemmatimonadales bacterium]|nr:hypothetical protein [Gemmatimonadales bacterium]